jgi:hypothetical protein
MKVAVISFSDLAKENRWDAGFHIALDEVRGRVDALKATVSADEAISRLAKFSLADKKPLLVLARGSNRHLNSQTITTIVNEYPHLSLAIMEQNLQPVIDKLRAQIEKNEASLDDLLALQAASKES